MAENEYLDSSKSRRWLSVARAICAGECNEEIAARTWECFCMTQRQIAKYFPLSEMIGLLSDPIELGKFCAKIEGDPNVLGFFREAADRGSNAEEALEIFLCDSLDRCLFDIPVLTAERGEKITISEVRRRLKDVRTCLSSRIERMAKKFAANPAWKPQVPRKSRKDRSDGGRTKEMLNESLIIGTQK